MATDPPIETNDNDSLDEHPLFCTCTGCEGYWKDYRDQARRTLEVDKYYSDDGRTFEVPSNVSTK